MAHLEHRARGVRQARLYIVTVSTSRHSLKAEGKPYTDESGDLAEEMAKEAGHAVVGRDLLPDDVGAIRRVLLELAGRDDVDVVVFTGGTGLTRSDVTIEAVRPFLEKEVEGFGELFRAESAKEVGTAAMLTRATAGVLRGKLVVLLPGSPNAVRVGMRLLLAELPHVLYLIRQ